MTTIGSLFTGYGGLDMGVAMAVDPDARVAWTSDVEPGPCKLAQVRWPDTPNLGDITQINWNDVEPVDIICGGSPCQDLSLAGKRAGMATGTRSGLWESMAAAVETIRPRLVVWENVQGALSARAYSPVESEPGMLGDRANGPLVRAAGRVVGDLATIGYSSAWRVVRASDAGAPHQRARLFLIGYPDGQPWDVRRPTTPRQAPSGRPHREFAGPGDDVPALIPTPTALDHKAGRHQDGTGHSLTQAVQLLPTPVAQPSGNSPSEHLRKKPGRDRVTDLAIIVENDLLPTGGLLPTPQATYAPRSSPGYGPNLHEAVAATDAAFGPYAPAIARWEQVTGRAAPPPTTPPRRAGGKPQLSTRFVEWMMGLPDGHVTDLDLSRERQLRMLGNGVVPQQAALAVNTLIHTAKDVENDQF